MATKTARTEEFSVSGDELLAKVKSLVHEGNIRRLTLKDEQGKALIEIPLTLGVAGAILAPALIAVGAIAAVASKLTVVVERSEK
jgi:hypothetical protein